MEIKMSDELKAAEGQDNKTIDQDSTITGDEQTANVNDQADNVNEPKVKEDPGFPAGDTGTAMLMRMNEHHKPLREWGFGFIEWWPGMEILDVGCGGGAAIHEMLLLSEGSIVKGIDHSDESISLSRVLNAEAIKYERCRIEKAKVEHMPFLDREFDLVTAIETMYFWHDPLAAMREIKRVVKRGGTFAVLAEACTHETWAEDRDKYPGTFKVYTSEEIADLMRSAGFRDIHAERGEGENTIVLGVK